MLRSILVFVAVVGFSAELVELYAQNAVNGEQGRSRQGPSLNSDMIAQQSSGKNSAKPKKKILWNRERGLAAMKRAIDDDFVFDESEQEQKQMADIIATLANESSGNWSKLLQNDKKQLTKNGRTIMQIILGIIATNQKGEECYANGEAILLFMTKEAGNKVYMVDGKMEDSTFVGRGVDNGDGTASVTDKYNRTWKGTILPRLPGMDASYVDAKLVK